MPFHVSQGSSNGKPGSVRNPSSSWRHRPGYRRCELAPIRFTDEHDPRFKALRQPVPAISKSAIQVAPAQTPSHFGDILPSCRQIMRVRWRGILPRGVSLAVKTIISIQSRNAMIGCKSPSHTSQIQSRFHAYATQRNTSLQ